MKVKLCNCGSGLESHWEYDARGIELDRVCPKCKDEKLSKYRPEVLSDPNYEADEDIEEYEQDYRAKDDDVEEDDDMAEDIYDW